VRVINPPMLKHEAFARSYSAFAFSYSAFCLSNSSLSFLYWPFISDCRAAYFLDRSLSFSATVKARSLNSGFGKWRNSKYFVGPGIAGRN
jgi:hypothetical protein